MIAWRGNVTLSFLGVFLILGSLPIFVFSEKEDWSIGMQQAFQIAGCIFDCDKNKDCRDKCDELIHNQTKPMMSRGSLANFKARLHCKDIDVVTIKHNPGIWVIQQSMDNGLWNNTIGRIKVSDRMLSTFTNLTAGTFYRYKAYRVIANGVISEPEITSEFATFKMGCQSKEVEYVKVARQVSDKRNLGRVRADIIFQPALDRSCHYDIVTWNSNEGWRDRLIWRDFDDIVSWNNNEGLWTRDKSISPLDFEFAVANLDLKTNVTVFVFARNLGNEASSTNCSRSFTTPYFSEMLDDAPNLAIRVPEQVEGLRVKLLNENSSNDTYVVAWDPLYLIPDFYHVQIESVDYGYKVDTVPGNTTESLFTYNDTCKFDSHCQLKITVWAESSSRQSPRNMISVKLSKTTNVTSPDIECGEIHIGIIIVPALATLTLVLGLVYAYYFGMHSKTKESRNNKFYKFPHNLSSAVNGNKRNLERTFDSMGMPAILESEKKSLPMPKDRFEIRPDQLKIKDILRSGASGIIRHGCYKISKNLAIDVAVKTIKDDSSGKGVQNFHREILIMKSIGYHQNIVSMVGCCTIDVARPMLVVEYCSQGDLHTYLRTLWRKTMTQALERRARCKNSTKEDVKSCIEGECEGIQEGECEGIQEVNASDKKVLSDANLLSFARQIACGMEFLSSNRIIHRDLAARNVLVCADNSVKISDFQLSRDIYQKNVYIEQENSRLAVKWMALEALTRQMYTRQSDVWSFGILLWELATLGCEPYPDTPTNMVLQLLKSGYRMKKPENCSDVLYDMMLSCWNSRPHSRPNFTQLKNQFDKLLVNVSENQYFKLYDIRGPLYRESCKKIKHSSNIYSIP